jgi:GMP synthase (glutamine-hydrolysing)
MADQTILILDFGGQYKDLIARRVRECSVYSEICPANISIEKIQKIKPIGIIFTGGPKSVYESNSPQCDPKLFELGIPILGICYGAQLMSYIFGGVVKPCQTSEYGQREIVIDPENPLFDGLEINQTVLMSHTDQIERLPEGFTGIAMSDSCKYAAIARPEKRLYGVQFHPEVELSTNGIKIIKNFLYRICGAAGDYSVEDYLNKQIAAVREQVGSEKVLLGLSGGVDSAVCAALLAQAVPDRLICIFVDHGLMRKDEGDSVEKAFSNMALQFVRVDASDRFLKKLEGVTDPEKKRKIIGSEFVDVFYEQAKKFGDAKFLAQGTIYPDVIESGTGSAATIKSHHNVGGLPKEIGFVGIIEPLRGLFKDEVRKLGIQLGLPAEIVNRQPFPGPGLAVRVIGEITRAKLDILREADAIFRYELESAGIRASQYFAVLTNLRSVGVMGDGRTYDYTIALRAVLTSDFMTCEYAPIPHKLLSKISRRITNEVKGVNRIVYDITDKPPATIEWE